MTNIKFNLAALETNRKLSPSRTPHNFRNQRNMIPRPTVQGAPDDWLSIIADQQRIALRRAPPQTLFPGGDLKIIELQSHGGVEKIETADGGPSPKYRQNRVRVCTCLLGSNGISGHRRSRLIFALHGQRESS